VRRRISARVVFAAATSLLGLSLLGVVVDPLPSGLRASYFRTGDLSGTPDRGADSEIPSTYSLFHNWHGAPPSTFSAQWSGWILIPRDGDYTFATISDDASAIVVDGQSVVDNGGVHGAQEASGTRRLARGVHNLYVSYTQSGGELALELLWARGDAPLAPLPAWALAPRPATFPRMAISAFLRLLLPVALWIWLPATVAAIAMGVARPIGRSMIAGDRRAAFEWTLVFGAGAMLIFVMPHRITSDAYVRYYALALLIEWCEVSGMLYSFIGPFCAAPLYFLGKFIGSPDWWCARFNALVLAGGVAVLWQLLRHEVDARLFRTFALLLLTASMFPNHVLDFFGEPLTTVLVAVGLVAVERGFPIAGWAAAIVGVANTPATMVGLAAAAGVRAWRTRRLRPFIAVALAAALIMLETWLRRGVLLHVGYVDTAGNRTILTYSGQPGFSYPLFFGLLSVLFSFGKGLVFYAPGLLLAAGDRLRAAGERLRRINELWLAFLIGLVLIYSKWWAWFGGWTWGPRFFLMASVPASWALAGALQRIDRSSVARRAAVLAILTLSTWVAIDGGAFELRTLDLCLDDTFASICWYVPEFSPLWRPFVVWTLPPLAQSATAAYFAAVYVWLAAPLVRDLAPRGLALAGDGWRALTQGEPWRV